MKKTISILLIALIAISGAIAVTVYNSKESALTALRDYKVIKELELSKATASINYTSDVNCILNYETEQPRCYVCFQYNSDDEEQTCINVAEGLTIEEIDSMVKGYVKNIISRSTDRERFEYVAETMKDRVISIDMSKEKVLEEI